MTQSSTYAVAPPPPVVLPITGSDAVFPVRRVYCVGRNYADHAIEMGHDPDAEPPFFFQKNPDNLVTTGRFPYPAASQDVHHEIELVIALKSGGRNIPAEAAFDHIFGYAVGLDMTRRDLQSVAKKAGRPWEVGKAFERSAPVSPITPIGDAGRMEAGAIRLTVNGTARQDGDLNQMIWKIPEIVATLSGLFTLAPGDLVFTGTPAGVGAVASGDRLVGEVDGLEKLDVTVMPAE